MKKVEMVRCWVSSPDNDDQSSSAPPTVRYVPSDIYRLWRYLMEDVKGFQIEGAETSFWVDDEMYSREKSIYGEHTTDHVTEVGFIYCRDSEVGRPVIRFFPQDQLEAILGFFMKNFPEEYIKGGLQKTNGFFVSVKKE
ncbi:MAG: hypothetical protein P9L99_09360 [Candidatus Lernaella stagnicola]|nr:hypothetical protein [Candidatus Lernaella stagnicola]